MESEINVQDLSKGEIITFIEYYLSNIEDPRNTWNVNSLT